jgi:hypothetical protein
MALGPPQAVQDNFTQARAAYCALYAKRRRCGTTLAGFCKALLRTPLSFWHAVRRRLQEALLERELKAARVGRWIGFGLDGTKLDLPRRRALERHFGVATKAPGGPQLLVVAVVALGQEILWDWAWSSALGSERSLALELIQGLPERAIAVFDAGFMGYDWGWKVVRARRHFLVRVGGNVNLWAHGLKVKTKWRDGEVWLWPEQKSKQPPLILRLIKLQRRVRKSKGDRRQFKTETLWLATDVLDPKELTEAEACELYQRRWPANECNFRSWKTTLDVRKLKSRTPRAVERECELSLSALMLLQVTMTLAQGEAPSLPSVANGVRAWRTAVSQTLAGKRTNGYGKALRQALRDRYHRRGLKRTRNWARRKNHRPPRAPILLRLGIKRKMLGENRLKEFGWTAG